ncbi:MAG: PAS domain S-box protein [Armatimonadota bacterium]|nr:PAS domain S-box protein [bacterium]
MSKSEARYRTIFDSLSDAILVCDLQTGEVLDANQRACELYGYTRDEMLHKSMDTLIPGLPPHNHEPPHLFESPAKDKSERVFWIEASLRAANIEGKEQLLAVIREVSDRKRLQLSGHKFQQLYENMMDAFCIVDMSGRMIEFNKAFKDMLGYSEDEIREMTFPDITPEKWRTTESQIIRDQILKRGYSDIYEKDYVNKDGHVIPVELRTFLVRDDSGEITGMCAIIRDITERKRSEEALRKSEIKFRSLVEQSPFAFSSFSPDGRLVYANPAWNKLWHVSLEDLEYMKEHWRILEDEQMKELGVTSYLERAFAGETVEIPIVKFDGRRSGENIGVEAGGKSIWTRSRAFPIHDDQDNIVEVVLLHEDVTNRVMAEEELRASEANYREIFDSVNDAIIVQNIDNGNIVDVNRTMMEMYHCTKEEAVNMRRDGFSEGLSPYTHKEALEWIRRAVEEGPQLFEWKARDTTGRLFWTEINVRKATIGGMDRILALVRDISERKHIEEELRASEANYREIFDSVNDVILVLNAETGEIVDVNRAFEGIYYYTREEVSNLDIGNISEGTPPYSQKDALKWVGKAAKKGPQLFEWKARRKTGEVFWVEVNLKKATIAGMDRVLAIVRDISGRKLIEEELRASEANYREIFNSVNDAIFVHDMNTGAILDVNRTMMEMYHCTSEEARNFNLGSISEGIPPYTHKEALEWIRKAAVDGAQIFEWRSKDPKERGFWVEVNLKRATIGGQDRVLALVRDISERKRAEEELRASEANYREIFDSVNDAILIQDIDNGAIVDVNRTFTEVLGHSREEAVKLIVVDISEGSPPYTQKEAMEWFRKAGAEGPQLFEWKCKRKTGEVFWTEVNLKKTIIGGVGRMLALIRDITERKKIEALLKKQMEELFESRQMLRTVLDAIPQRVFWKDKNSVYVGCNKSFATDIGLADPSEVIGKTDYDTSPPGMADKYRATDLEIMETGRWKLNFEDYVTKPDGCKSWLLTSKVPLLDENGDVTGVLGTYHDITDRKQMEEALRISEMNYETIFNVIDYGIVIYDLDTGVILDVNSTAKALFDRPEEEIIGRTADMLSGEDHRYGAKVLEKLAAGKPQTVERLFRNKDGELSVWEVHLNTAVLQGVKRIVGVIHDATERKRAEEALKNSEEKFRAVAEYARAGIMLVQDERVIYANPYAVEYTGRPLDEIIGISRGLMISPEYRDIAEEQMLRSMAGEALTSGDLKVITPSGEVKWIQMSSASFDYMGKRTLLTVAIDITERNKARESLLELTRTLESRVAERTLQLETANKEMEAFTYSVSHDLRAPLRSIDGFSMALLEEYSDALDATGQDYLRRVRAAAQRMGRLIDDLLRLSRINRAEMLYKNVNISGMALEILTSLQQTDTERKMEFVIQPDIEVRGDANLLRIAMENLLDNAWKFTGRRSVGRIEVGTELTDSEQIVYVRDNGAGFDMAYLEKLFQPFHRLHADAEFPGTGIGLAIVRRVISRHGGRVWATGEVDHGAVFSFALPR